MSDYRMDIFTSRRANSNANVYVGEAGRLFYDQEIPLLRLSDGVSPGGIIIGNSQTNGNISGNGTSGFLPIFNSSNSIINAPIDYNITNQDIITCAIPFNVIANTGGANFGIAAAYFESDCSPTVNVGVGFGISGIETDIYLNLDRQHNIPGQIVAFYSYAENDGALISPTSFIGLIGEVVNAGGATLPLSIGLVGHNQTTSGTIANAYSIYARSNDATGGIITNGIGLFVDDQTQATNNWAIKTGLGLVQFGGGVKLSGIPGNGVSGIVSIAADGTLSVGNINQMILYVSGNITATVNQYVFANTVAGNITVTLPASLGNTSLLTRVKKISSDTNFITVNTTGSDLVDANSSITFETPMTSLTFVADGINKWWVT